MRKLSKKNLKSIEDAQRAVNDASETLRSAIQEIKDEGEGKLSAVSDAVEEFNSWLQEAKDNDLDEAFTTYQDAMTDGRDLMEELANDADNYFDDKSEKWQEGEKGEAYGEWRDRLREIADEFDEPECPEIEFDFECPEFFDFDADPDDIKNGDDLFEDIPEEPEL